MSAIGLNEYTKQKAVKYDIKYSSSEEVGSKNAELLKYIWI